MTDNINMADTDRDLPKHVKNGLLKRQLKGQKILKKLKKRLRLLPATNKPYNRRKNLLENQLKMQPV